MLQLVSRFNIGSEQSISQTSMREAAPRASAATAAGASQGFAPAPIMLKGNRQLAPVFMMTKAAPKLNGAATSGEWKEF